MKDLIQGIEQELGQGREIVLATIIHQKGSAPRTQGTRFLIRPDGTFLGSIGGGRLEADVLQEAPKVFREKKQRLLSFRLKGEEAAETEMICGGEVDIYLELFSGLNRFDRELFQKILSLRQQGHPAVLATWIEDGLSADHPDRKGLFGAGEGPGSESLPWLRPLIEDHPRLLEGCQNTPITILAQWEGKTILLERLVSPAPLYIFGAGHISLYLCSLCKMVGFQITVFDDRAEFANPQRFPEADEIQVRPFDQIFETYPFGPQAYVVVVTRGHLHDYQIIRQILKNPPAYLGMIGSRHKKAVVFKALKEEGFSEDQIGRIHSPIGLAINAETPEEIAVSITAQLIQVRGEGRPEKSLTRTLPMDLLSGLP